MAVCAGMNIAMHVVFAPQLRVHLAKLHFRPFQFCCRVRQDKVHLPPSIFRFETGLHLYWLFFIRCFCESILTRIRFNSFQQKKKKLGDNLLHNRLVDLCRSMQHVFAWLLFMCMPVCVSYELRCAIVHVMNALTFSGNVGQAERPNTVCVGKY